MRAAQIGSDGFLRDADGSLYGGTPRGPVRPTHPVHPVHPVRRAHPAVALKSRPRLSGGLGQTGSELRAILEGASLGLPRPTPVSQLKLRVGNGGRSLMGNWQTEVYVGRFVFPSANIDPATCYIVSARPAPRGMIRLMKIDGENGTWVDFPVDPVDGNPGAVCFRRDFLVASLPAEMMAISLFTTFGPVFENDPEKKPDPMRASTAYCRAMLVSAVDIITSTKDPGDPNAPEPFSERDVYNMAERKAKALELAPRILTAFGLVDEAINSTGAGYDTRYIGMNALALLTVKTGVPMINELVRMWGHLADAVNTDQTEHYEKLAQSLNRYVVSSLLWGQYLMRALIFTNLTATSGPKFDEINRELLVACYDLLEGVRGREGEIAQLSGLTVDQVEKFKAPFQKYYDTYFTGQEGADKTRDEMLSKAGMDNDEYELGYYYNVEALQASTRVIRQLVAPRSVDSSLDPEVFKGLAGLEALGAGGGGVIPLRLQRAYRINKVQIMERKENVKRTFSDQEQETQRERFYKEVYTPLKAMAEAELKPAEDTIKESQLLQGDRWKDPRVIREIIEAGRDPKAAAEVQQVSKSLQQIGVEGIPTLVEQARGLRGVIEAIDVQAAADPYAASVQMLSLGYREIYSPKYSNVLAYSRTSKVKIHEMADTFALAFRRIVPGGKLDPVQSRLAAITFRAKLEETYGMEVGSATKLAIDYLEKQAVVIEKKIAEGEPSVLDPSVKVPIKNEVVLRDEAATLRRLGRNLRAFLTEKGIKKYGNIEAAAYQEAEIKDFQEKRKANSDWVPDEANWKQVNAEMSQADLDRNDYFAKEGIYSDTVLKIVKYEKFQGENPVEAKMVEELKSALADLRNKHAALDTYRGNKSKIEYVDYVRNPDQGKQFLADYYRAKERLEVIRDRLTTRMNFYEKRNRLLRWGKNFWDYSVFLAYTGPKYIREKLLPQTKWVQTPFAVAMLPIGLGATYLFAYVIVKILSFVPWAKAIFAPVAELAETGFATVFGGTDPHGSDYWTAPVENVGKKEPLGIWGMAGLGVALAAILSPRTVIPFVVKAVSGVVRGIGGVVGGKPGRGRPPGAKKPGVGPGAPPNVQKAISAIRRGREEGNPFLVKKGVEALKKAKAMGLPVPKGIID